MVVPVVQNEDEQVLWLRKTEHPDVYDVYQAQNNTTKLGVAHIASLKVSKQLRSVFKDLTVTVSVAFRCRYNTTFHKYEPIAESV